MKLTLRDYQREALDATLEQVGEGKHPLCVLPTGAGKSLVLASLIARMDPEPVLVLSHVKELLEQDARALRLVAPKLQQRFFVAGLGEKDASAQVVFGSVQSVFRSLNLFRKRRAVVAVDEAHLCPRKGRAMYAQVFDHFAAAQRIGFTATPSRMDSGSLVEGEGAWFDCIAYSKEPKELIDDGFLVPLSGILTPQQADLSKVAMQGGEFVFAQAEEAVARTLSLSEAVESMKEHAKGRKSWLVFAAGIEHSMKVAEALRDGGVSAEVVTSKTEDEEREAIISRFKAGEFRALVNVGVLTTGFDAPATDCIVSLRPTQSKVLWQQMLGRGMRLSEGKRDCLLLDFVGNLDRLGGVGVVLESIDLRTPEALAAQRKKKRSRKAEREDPTLIAASLADPMLSGRTFEAIVNKVSFFTVSSRRFPGKKILVGVYDLQDEFGRALSARCFVCLEYEGGARYHAMRWFARRGLRGDDVPRSADQALLLVRVLPRPSEVEARYDRGMGCFVIENESFPVLDESD